MDLSGQSQEADSKSGSSDSAQQGGNLTDEDRIRLGAQQAALIHMLQIEDAEKQHIMVDEQRSVICSTPRRRR
ncbi:hypothetical protein NP493_574g01001 [Ridgeia piscesae]|uniref:Uncharacterized protein n=1 Tax=Ridgeia piscesae TaxID=27915 RepID=A0AAD9KUV5_RIDPI|nr:hypothetical protein NP493_574g01001 [Ridgeia piscesae]